MLLYETLTGHPPVSTAGAVTAAPEPSESEASLAPTEQPGRTDQTDPRDAVTALELAITDALATGAVNTARRTVDTAAIQITAGASVRQRTHPGATARPDLPIGRHDT